MKSTAITVPPRNHGTDLETRRAAGRPLEGRPADDWDAHCRNLNRVACELRAIAQQIANLQRRLFGPAQCPGS